MSVLGLDLGHASVQAAEHWLSTHSAVLGRPGLVACTHLIHGDRPRVAVSLAGWASLPRDLPRTVDRAVETRVAATHAAGAGGRAVIYPGVALLTGELTVGEVLARSAIGRVRVLGGGDADPDAVVLTRDYVRPQWSSGVLTLVVQPGPGERLVPFEVPDPTPCCADHP